MKRFAVGFVGFCYGLVVTWLCLFALSRLEWIHDPHRIAHGCNELGMCRLSWYNWPMLYVFVFGPATLGAALNVYAWNRWRLKRWTCYAVSMTALVAALYFGSAFFVR